MPRRLYIALSKVCGIVLKGDRLAVVICANPRCCQNMGAGPTAVCTPDASDFALLAVWRLTLLNKQCCRPLQ